MDVHELLERSPHMVADDLFAGAGGWDLAAGALGILGRGVENMPEARLTRSAAGLCTIHDDVWTYRPDGFARGLIASPPCQTFSQAGSGSGRKALDAVLALVSRVPSMTLEELREAGAAFGDPANRTALVLTPLWFAMNGSYRWLAWEQVPAVLPVWEACAEVLRAAGWSVWTGMLHAEQYGVPQTRKRAVLIASLDVEVKQPTPTHSRYHSRTPEKLDQGVKKWVSMAEALGIPTGDLVGFPRRADSDDVVVLDGVEYRARDLRSADRPSQVVTEKARSWKRFPSHMGDVVNRNGCVRPIDAPAPTMTGSMDNGNFQWVDRVNNQSGTEYDLDEQLAAPAVTIAGRGLVPFRGANANRFNGSTKSRNDGVRVTVDEAGVLQTFPHDHPWQGTQTKQYLQAGNAVPPLLALHIIMEASRHA